MEYGSLATGAGVSRDPGPSHSGDAAAVITALTRNVPDFPEPGVLFRDLTRFWPMTTGSLW